MPKGAEFAEGSSYSVKYPLNDILPILLTLYSVNHKSPVRSDIIDITPAFSVGRETEMLSPAALIRPIRLPRCSVNHMAPSLPLVIPYGPESCVLIIYSWIMTVIHTTSQKKSFKDAASFF